MTDLAIFGAGGFGRETALLVEQINNVEPAWNFIGFYDDGFRKGEKVRGARILGGLSDLNQQSQSLSVVLAIADPTTRRRVSEKMTNANLKFPSLVHPSAMLGDVSNKFGNGCIITAQVVCTTSVHLGEFIIVNLGATIGHDVVIGNFSTLMPACHISGGVVIGESVMIGTGACVLQSLKIGDRSKVGAGAVVTQAVRADKTVVGVPAKEIADAERI
jgi:sugar O-acyltransferase (sialic acid O-acetyltransferase NeuD family)